MSKTTLLLIVTLFASVAVHSVSSVAADSFALTNSSFYKEKGSAVLVAAGDASLVTSTTSVGINRQLIAGKNSKTNYYVYQTNTPSNKDTPKKGGSTTVTFKKIDVNKLAFVEKADTVTVTGLKWGGSTSSSFIAGASVKNNVTLIDELYVDPAVDNAVKNIYAYVIDLDKNEKTEVIVASGKWTSDSDKTDVALVEDSGYISGALTVILYTTTVVKDTSTKSTLSIVTLKGTTLGTPVTVKEFSYTTGETPNESVADDSGTGQNYYVVLRSSTTSGSDTLYTETVYSYTVTEKEIKAGSTAVINTNVADTNEYAFKTIHAHAEGRWVAVYSNQTGDATPYTRNLVAKASNDTAGFKILITRTDVTGTSISEAAETYFGGLVIFATQSTDTAGGSAYDQYTYTYQTFGGDLTTLGTKTTYAAIAGTKYAGNQKSTVQVYRLGDAKAINVLANQVAYNGTADPVTYTSEGLYFGQLFQKSFGATLQSVLAVSSLMLAALFFF